MLAHYLVLMVVLYSACTKAQIQGDPLIPDETEKEPDYLYPNVLSMKFHLLHSRIHKLLTKIPLLEMDCPIKQCNISLFDIVDAIQLDRYSIADIATAIEKMNITGRDAYNIFLVYNLNVDTIQNLLLRAGFTFTDLYKNIVEHIQGPANTIPQILGTFNVSVIDFMNAQAYGNDTTKLEVLATGNYSFENIQLVLNLVNKTGIDLLKAFPLNTIAKNLRNFDAIEFRNLVKNFGITSMSLEEFYKYLNVSSINFIAYPGFTEIITNFENYLNPEEVIATVVGKTTLVTNNKGKSLAKFLTENTDFVRNYSYFQAENIENPLIHYHVKNVLLNNNEYKANDIAFVEVHNAYKGNISELGSIPNATKLLNCTYVTKLPFGEIYVEAISIVENIKGHALTLVKTPETVYNLGSPLFCQGKLIAIASQDGVKEIQFSTFMTKTGELPKPSSPLPAPGNVTTPNPAVPSKPGSGSKNTVNIFVILTLIALKALFV